MNAARVIKLISVGIVVCVALTGCSDRSNRMSNETPGVAKNESDSTQNMLKPKVFYRASAEKRLDALEKQLAKDYKLKDSQAFYYYNFADLNNDQSNELLVYLGVSKQEDINIYDYYLIIYDEAYKVLLTSSEVSAPIFVLNQYHNSWSDLAVYMSKGMYKRIIFENDAYKISDKSNENVINFDELEGVCYLSNVRNENGFLIK